MQGTGLGSKWTYVKRCEISGKLLTSSSFKLPHLHYGDNDASLQGWPRAGSARKALSRGPGTRSQSRLSLRCRQCNSLPKRLSPHPPAEENPPKAGMHPLHLCIFIHPTNCLKVFCSVRPALNEKNINNNLLLWKFWAYTEIESYKGHP